MSRKWQNVIEIVIAVLGLGVCFAIFYLLDL